MQSSDPALTLPASSEDSNAPMQTLNADEADLFTRDPASFLITSAVTGKLRDSASELKKLISHAKPELAIVFDKVVAAMSKLNLIRIFGDKIIVLKSAPYADLDKAGSFSFLPKIASILCGRILKNSQQLEQPSQSEHIRWHYMPDHPLVHRRLVEIQKRYCEEMDQLNTWVENNPELTSDKLRLTMLISGNLNPEDF